MSGVSELLSVFEFVKLGRASVVPGSTTGHSVIVNMLHILVIVVTVYYLKLRFDTVTTSTNITSGCTSTSSVR